MSAGEMADAHPSEGGHRPPHHIAQRNDLHPVHAFLYSILSVVGDGAEEHGHLVSCILLADDHGAHDDSGVSIHRPWYSLGLVPDLRFGGQGQHLKAAEDAEEGGLHLGQRQAVSTAVSDCSGS
jgi:hypothetical protein